MHRTDSSVFLLYIEPKKEKKLPIPIEDKISQIVEIMFAKADIGAAAYSHFNNDKNWDGDFTIGDGKRTFFYMKVYNFHII